MRLTRLEGNPVVERSADLDATAAYNNEGSVTTINYPTSYQWTMQDTLYTVAGDTFTYTFDAMYRPTGLTGAGVSGVQYGPGGQMTVGPFGITRQYNERGQLTRIGNAVEYTYSATTNDGRITKQKDLVSGEEVNYLYDSLGRVSSASTTGPEWGLSFTYDGFGNRTAQTVTKGTAPSQTISADPATNRIGGLTYDLNGNATSAGTSTLSYDVANRLVSATNSPNGTEQYGYGPDNRRIWRRYGGAFDEFYFYGPTGQKIGAYKVFAVNGDCGQVPCGLYFEKITTFTYFVGMPLNGLRDRLGSDISGGKKYYPYGEERVVTANNVDKFATYYRDGHTGLDYADQRYYSNQYGRFLTPDPYQGSGGPSSPTSWNRFAYVLNDPVRYSDPDGLNPNDCSVVGCLMAPPEDGGGVIAFGTLGGSTFGQETAAAEAQHAQGVNDQFQANQANSLLSQGNVTAAAQIVAGNSNLTATPTPGSGNFNGGSTPLVTSTITFAGTVQAIKEYAKNAPAWAGTVNVPIPGLLGLNIMVPFAFLPSQSCIGVGLALGGPGPNYGPVLWGSTSAVGRVVSGFGWSAVGQFGAGIQYMQSGQISVGGPTVGSQGASIGYGYSRCFP